MEMGLLTVFTSLFLIIVSYPEAQSSVDITRLIYRGCSNQQFPDPSDNYIQNLKSLFQTLISQSTKTNFSKTTIGNGQDSIFGLYQCRGDLTAVDCYDCVSQFPKLTKNLCGKTIAARFQLLGCYMRYEVSGFKQISSTELLYKYCRQGSNSLGIGSGNLSSGFDQNRDLAFQQVEKDVVSSGGFYTTSYGSDLFVLGQCEGDLGGQDCGDCITAAFERVKAVCGDSIEGQVYLHQCYISYTYYPNGVQVQQGSSSSGASHSNIQKTVAIVFGAAAGVGLIVVALLCTKSALKKKPQNSQKHSTTYTYNM